MDTNGDRNHSCTRDDLATTIQALGEPIRDWLADREAVEIAEKSKDFILEQYSKEQDKLTDLFLQAEYLCRQQQPRSMRVRSLNFANEPASFYDLVTASRHMYKNKLEHSRASILAVALSRGPEYLLEIWDSLLQHIGLLGNQHATATEGFNDACLPFLNPTQFFSGEQAEMFDESQHEYCQVDPRDVRAKFDVVRKQLKDLIQKESIKCKTTSQLKAVSYKRWMPVSLLEKVVNSHQKLIGMLYTGWFNKQGAPPQDHRRLRQYHLSLTLQRRQFLRLLPSRLRLFATLVRTADDVGSWHNFFDPDSISDPNEPLCLDCVVQYLGLADADPEDFYNEQFRYYCVKLQLGRETIWKHPHLNLPLLKMEWLAQGCFGHVWRVRISQDGWHEKDYAMKVIERTTGSLSYTEWRLTETLAAQSMTAQGIMAPLACVRSCTKVYIFMPLADCDLFSFMTERLPAGPSGFQDRKKKLLYMHDLARAVQYIHTQLYRREGTKETIIHGDLKASNILYTEKEEFPLQIADFGISMFQTRPQTGSPDHLLSYSARDLRTRLKLGEACLNFPPEAELDGQGDSKVDIWGYGTVFAEYIAWLSGGLESLNEFRRERQKGLGEEFPWNYKDLSYGRQSVGGEAKLKGGIETWYETLIQRTTDVSERMMYQSCWEMIRDGLLVCDPEVRWRIDRVSRKISHIIESYTEYPDEPTLSAELHGQFHWHQPGHRRTISRPPIQDIPHLSRTLTPVDSVHSATLSSPDSVPDSTTAASSPRVDNASFGVPASGPLDSSSIPSPNQNGTVLESRETAFRKRVFKGLRNGEAEQIALMINGENDCSFRDDDRNTALHFSVECESVVATEKLLKYHPALLTARNKAGETALYKCARQHARAGINHLRLMLETEASQPVIEGRSVVTIPDHHDTHRTPMYVLTNHLPNPVCTEMVGLLASHHKLLSLDPGRLGKYAGRYKRQLA